MKIKEHDRVEIKTKKDLFSGIVMPNSDKKTLFIKLNNGYNIGIERKNIKVIKKKKSKIVRLKSKKSKTKIRKGLPTITLLHTGGTISSKVDYRTGAVIPTFDPDDMVEMFPELGKIANIRSNLVSNTLSENMRFNNYKLIAKEIEREVKKGCGGIVISHGTDTLHYTSAALSFILEDIPIPIILVGSQRSSDRGSSDAFLNLLSAFVFAAKSDFSGIAICMHENMDDENCLILPGLKTRKMHTSRRDAFKPINEDRIARVNPKNKKIVFFSKYEKKNKKRKLKIYPEMEKKVAIIKTHTNMDAKQFEFYRDYKGLVIEGTGLGHIPGGKENKKIVDVVKNLAKKIPIIMTSQTIFGRVNMNVYAPQRELLEAGVIPGEDMTAETAFIKLAWLLKNKKKEARNLMGENLKGEINPRLMEDHYLW